MENKKEYFYMLLRDVSINAQALKKIADFEPSCDEIEALEALHDDIGFHFNSFFVDDGHYATKEDWQRLQREIPAIEVTK
tara:strand:- start:349 stop:588 length:240 start_codon:yes stop_codon:yes gene_type:complete